MSFKNARCEMTFFGRKPLGRQSQKSGKWSTNDWSTSLQVSAKCFSTKRRETDDVIFRIKDSELLSGSIERRFQASIASDPGLSKIKGPCYKTFLNVIKDYKFHYEKYFNLCVDYLRVR
jgi:hypothetical protein